MAERYLRNLLAGGILATLAACTTMAGDMNGMGGMITDGQTFQLKPGAQVMLADHSELQYVRLVNESRCMPNVQCIRAGDAEIAMRWMPASGGADEFSLKIPPPAGPQTHDAGGRRLTLLSLDRGDAPQAQFRIERMP